MNKVKKGQLSLTRKIGEEIIIGDDILFKIVDIVGSQVRVSITAPIDIEIYRKEIYKKPDFKFKKDMKK